MTFESTRDNYLFFPLRLTGKGGALSGGLRQETLTVVCGLDWSYSSVRIDVRKGSALLNFVYWQFTRRHEIIRRSEEDVRLKIKGRGCGLQEREE